ncbi:thiamine biosynthesis protein ThiS [Polynucleobacter sp. TUM22923]|jgi:sulfur carrier protein|uniref:sulfur carrier protein ThiS n=1 Tax=Polynucleobacter sp. TUM22923 TaxID=3022126 RepID=UPI0025742413|nr:sulfur carrier protein ThiS [Polynucleobacter sp. TUM22923]BDX21457.1 thiamine biosynthesis protein ThiS [Polynucleobacter sp. TUM22923]
MRLIVNQIEQELPDQSTIDDVLEMIKAIPPFAVAVNFEFVPKSTHSEHILNEGDQLEIISPVTGG